MKRTILYIVLFCFILLSIWTEAQLKSIKVVAANVTSGQYQKYEGPGIRILQALKPDICCIQEFNYDGNIADFVKTTFGTDFKYYREPYNNSGDIPNGVIFHDDFKLLDSGSWKDSQITNRGYTYVKLDIPGDTNPHLFVISVHLSTQSSKRDVEAKELIAYIKKYYNVSRVEDVKDYIVLAGDFNAGSRSAQVLWILKQDGGFIDNPIPVDQNSNSDTNSSRSKEHDFVITNALLQQCSAVLTIGNQTFPNGLVFDSRVYKPLSDVSPVLQSDSGASNMQHMAVVRVFLVPAY